MREPELLGGKYLASPFGELSKPCTADAVREPDPNLSPAVTTLDFLPPIFLVSELVSVGPGIGARCCGVAHDGYDRPQNQAILAVLRSGKPGGILACRDFKSSASAIPPPGQWYLQSNESSPSPQQHGWPGGLRKDSGDLLAGCDSFVSSSRIGRRRKVSKLSGDADSVFPSSELESASSPSWRSVCDNFCQLRDGKRHHRAIATHATAHNSLKVR